MDESRKQFTTWFNSPEQSELRMSCSMGWAYKIWCESRAAIEIKLPSQSEYDDPLSAYNAINDCAAAIRAVSVHVRGIKVKE